MSVKYLGYYDTQTNESENRGFFLAASQKMDYILGVLSRAGYSVQVVSASTTRNAHSYRGKIISLKDGTTLRLFRTLPWGGMPRRVTSRLSMQLFLFLWLLFNTRKREDVIVYHSLGYASAVALAHSMRGFRLILEVEEVYADVSGRRKDRKREYSLFDRADAFIFPTELMNQTLNPGGKPYVVVHGTYDVEPERRRCFRDGRIHVVYAGTFDPRKGGGVAAVAAAEYLDARYHLHIIGFGSDSDTQLLISQVDALSKRADCRLTYDGLLAGEEYSHFLQSCDIGLSTQKLAGSFNETSFPSKVLSYMANGLRVVSIRLPVLEQSGVGDMIIYYDEDAAPAIANAIKSVDISQPHDGRQRLRELDAAFATALGALMGERVSGGRS